MHLPTFATIGLAAFAALSAPVAAAPTDFGPGTKIGRVADLPPLPRNMRGLYAQFRREASYFAAFAVNYQASEGFYIQNFHDAARARAAALEGCAQIYGREGCVIYAVAIPLNLLVSQPNASGLSEKAADDFNSRYQSNRKPGTYAAFAISGASHHGFGNAYAIEADARDTAIAYCKIGVAMDMAELGPEARKFARARDWNDCTVVDVEFTPNN